MTESFDLAVIGAGPAGIGAALSATECGLKTAIFDEAPRAGGQVYRALPEGFAPNDPASLGPDHATGEGLRRALEASPADRRFGHRVWMIKPGFEVHSLVEDQPLVAQASALVVATGTHERAVPVPGWTLPGVIGLAAATILLKADRMLPGEATVVAGCGPLLAAVAAGILDGGGKVAALVDLAGPGDWLKTLPELATRPDLLRKGVGWLARIRRAGVPMFFRHAVAEVRGDGVVEGVVLRTVGRDGRVDLGKPSHSIGADSVAIGYGLVPGTDITRLLRARHRYAAERGGWIAEHDGSFRSSIPRLYVAGDGAGISGAAAALLQGRIAGLVAAMDLHPAEAGGIERRLAPLRAELARAERFGGAMARLMAPPPGVLSLVTPETVVCRCEDVTRAELDRAVAAGAAEVNQLKSWTRCGMGPCQGRMCGDIAAAMVAATVGSREQAGQWTGRTPLRPISVQAMLGGDYRYEDIWTMQRGNFPPPMPFADEKADAP